MSFRSIVNAGVGPAAAGLFLALACQSTDSPSSPPTERTDAAPTGKGGASPLLPPLGFGGAPVLPEDNACQYTKLLATALEGTLGAPVRFVGFFESGIVGEIAGGESVLIHFPALLIVRMPADARDLRIVDVASGFVLACSSEECALLEPDAGNPELLHRVRGGGVPLAGSWSNLDWTEFELCVSDAAERRLCFDRTRWMASDGTVVAPASPRDAGALDGAPGSDATVEAAAPLDGASEKMPCAAPIYCSGPDLWDDPLCYYVPSGRTLYGVTAAGRMVHATHDGNGGAVECWDVSPAFGPPVGLASSTCGLSHHVVLLTEEGLFETCGCLLD